MCTPAVTKVTLSNAIIGVSDIGHTRALGTLFIRKSVQVIIGHGNGLILGIGLGGEVADIIIAINPVPHVRIVHS